MKFNISRKLRIIIGAVALVVIVGIIIIIAINGGKGKAGDSSADPSATPPASSTIAPSATTEPTDDAQATEPAEPTATIDPSSGSDIDVTPGPATDSNLPTEEQLNEYKEQYLKEQEKANG